MTMRPTAKMPPRRVVIAGLLTGLGAASEILAPSAILGQTALASNLTGLISPHNGAELITGEIGTAGRIIDGDSFVLSSGLSVRLAAIETPKPALRAQNRAAWPFAAQARAGLLGLIKDRQVALFYGGEKRDRYKRAVAQIYTLSPDGRPDLWVQQELVRLGLARVLTQANQAVDSEKLYAQEARARAAGRGIWSHPFYDIRGPEPNQLAQYVDSTQIVEGIILSTADVRGRIYLNFGVDYKTDFTVSVAKKHVKDFAKANVDLLGLEGARIRVRGWIELINGPSIWLDHPERLEILDG